MRTSEEGAEEEVLSSYRQFYNLIRIMMVSPCVCASDQVYLIAYISFHLDER